MPFSNPILGGDFLVRPAIKSPNYSAGVSGWSINKDGSVEFNNGTFRGSLTSGTNPGRHIILNNSATGDAVDVYDSGNNLVYEITNQGAAISINPSDGRRATIFDAALQLLGANWYMDMFYSEPSPFTPSSQPEVVLEVFSGGNPYALYLRAGSADGTQPPTLMGSEQNIQGSMVQADTQGSGNLVHTGNYTGSVFDGFGDVTINHGAGFTPRWGFLQSWDWNSTGQHYQCTWVQNWASATSATFFTRQQGGGIPPVGTVVGVHGWFVK